MGYFTRQHRGQLYPLLNSHIATPFYMNTRRVYLSIYIHWEYTRISQVFLANRKLENLVTSRHFQILLICRRHFWQIGNWEI